MSNDREIIEQSIVKSVEEAAGVYCEALYQYLARRDCGRPRNMLKLSIARLVLEPVASEHHECYPLDHDIQREDQF